MNAITSATSWAVSTSMLPISPSSHSLTAGSVTCPCNSVATTPGSTAAGHVLVAYAAEPGSASQEALRLPASWVPAVPA
ncbi:hypothetical protein [Nonomuraea endophytica]|uniref:Uncharacterized protein n=1 Tax=Nonomuraea endophytica TaxID=714136 RepID=A0A7W8EIE8_9ACTN|nr:hypothetical protein [Nonomuraea endophytica]MBB5081940.1 hypothetical protein [Nonomuraea endophytica]